MPTNDLPLGGHWGLALIMIGIGIWLVYRFLAPKSWKEWRGAGLVQAFVIALYAEMYGFPLTIYLLTNFLDLDIPWLHLRGHLWSTLLGLGDTGAMVEMFIGFGVVLVGLLLIVRGWRQIYKSRHEDMLVTSGLYAYARHPQYTGIFLVLFGQLIHWPTLPTLVLFPFIVWAYVHLARKEEKELVAHFGNDYREYREKTPMFFPKLREWPDFLSADTSQQEPRTGPPIP